MTVVFHNAAGAEANFDGTGDTLTFTFGENLAGYEASDSITVGGNTLTCNGTGVWCGSVGAVLTMTWNASGGVIADVVTKTATGASGLTDAAANPVTGFPVDVN